MNLRGRAALVSLREALVADINVRDIEDYLMTCGLLSLEDKQLIHAACTTRQQTSKLLDILMEKNIPGAFEDFLFSLEETYPHLMHSLIKCQSSPQTFWTNASKDFESVFIEGGIPIVPEGNVELKYVDELKEKLATLADRSDGGWILVSGYGGSGKSVLAAQAIRGADSNGNPIASFFYNRVHWFTIGSNFRGNHMESMLLTKMQTICARLDPTVGNCLPRNLEAAKDMLRIIMLKQQPCGLIVLDDVWDPNILRHFNVEARVIVTSRNCNMLCRIQRGSSGRCSEICVAKGFSEKMTMALLDHIINGERTAGQASDSFSKEDQSRIRSLHRKCKGNPFVISIFGGLLRGRQKQFDRYLKMFEENMKSIPTASGGSDYEYDNINDAILVSIDDLDAKDMERYLRLAIFPEDTFLTVKFLATYCWADTDCVAQLSEDDALELMEKFSSRSIASAEKYLSGMPLFTLHDLIVKALRTKYTEKRKGYNNEFVERVISRSRLVKSWLKIEDETDYLAFNFVYHLVACDAITINDKMKILLDFDFISWICSHIGASNLALVYRYALTYLQTAYSNDEEHLDTFVNFFRSPIFRLQTTHLVSRGSDSALIQLALTLPEDDHVRGCAEDAARSHSHFFCFYAWRNNHQMDEQIGNAFAIEGQIVSFSVDSRCKDSVVAFDSSVLVLSLETGLKTLCVHKKDLVPADSTPEKQSNVKVVAALFGPQKKVLFILTESALIVYPLPDRELHSDQERAYPMPPSQHLNLHFPPDRPRTPLDTAVEEQLEQPQIYPLEVEDAKGEHLTSMCFKSNDELLVGSSCGKIFMLNVNNSCIESCSQFFIDSLEPETCLELKISHITVACTSQPLPMVAVSGPNDCVYVYTNSYAPGKYDQHREYPIRCVLEQSATPKFAASITDNELHLWNPQNRSNLSRIKGTGKATFTCLAISSDGAFLAVGTNAADAVFLYQVQCMESSTQLVFVNKLTGYGAYITDLAFSTSRALYSVSGLLNEGVLTCWSTSLGSSTLFDCDSRSSYFFEPDSRALRLRTVFDAVTIDTDILVACQHTCHSLLILKSTNANLSHVAHFSGSSSPLGEATSIGISPDGKYAVFALPDCVVVAQEVSGIWNFVRNEESVGLQNVVVLSNCCGFIGSDHSCNLVVYQGSSCVQRTELSHLCLIALDSVLISKAHAHAIVLFGRNWSFLSDELRHNDDTEAVDNDSFESIICLDSCLLMQCGYVAGGTDSGSLVLWRFDDGVSPTVVDVSRREQHGSLCCVRASHIIDDFCLLAGAFDDHRYTLWALREGRLVSLLACQPVQTFYQTQLPVISCIAWAQHTDTDGEHHHKLIVASDCVRVCCLPQLQICQALSSEPPQRLLPSMVSLFSRQSVAKVQVHNNGHDLLFVDESHTVFWMRTLHSESTSAPLIPLAFSSEQS